MRGAANDGTEVGGRLLANFTSQYLSLFQQRIEGYPRRRGEQDQLHPLIFVDQIGDIRDII